MNRPGADRFRLWAGAYVLSSLPADERDEFEQHLARCARCRETVADIADIPTLLDTLTPEQARALPVHPPRRGNTQRWDKQ